MSSRNKNNLPSEQQQNVQQKPIQNSNSDDDMDVSEDEEGKEKVNQSFQEGLFTF